MKGKQIAHQYKCYFTWNTKGVRCYPKFYYRGPKLYWGIIERAITESYAFIEYIYEYRMPKTLEGDYYKCTLVAPLCHSKYLWDYLWQIKDHRPNYSLYREKFFLKLWRISFDFYKRACNPHSTYDWLTLQSNIVITISVKTIWDKLEWQPVGEMIHHQHNYI